MEHQQDCFGGWSAMPEQQAQKKVVKGVGKVVKKVVPIAAPAIGTAIGGPAGGKAGQAIGSAVGGGGGGGKAGGGGGPTMGGMMPSYGNPYGGGKGGFAGSGIGGLLGHNLSQADKRKEYERYMNLNTGDWKDRITFQGDEGLRMWDQMLPRRGQEFDQNLGFQGRMFDQWLPQQGRLRQHEREQGSADFWQDMAHDKAMRNRDLKYNRLQDEASWGNWDTGIGKLGGLSGALGLK